MALEREMSVPAKSLDLGLTRQELTREGIELAKTSMPPKLKRSR
jgi:hypothetical protein